MPVLESIDNDTFEEWGEYGDCRSHLDGLIEEGDLEPDVHAELEVRLNELDISYGPAYVERKVELNIFCEKNQLGKHYGAHCIWCLEAP